MSVLEHADAVFGEDAIQGLVLGFYGEAIDLLGGIGDADEEGGMVGIAQDGDGAVVPAAAIAEAEAVGIEGDAGGKDNGGDEGGRVGLGLAHAHSGDVERVTWAPAAELEQAGAGVHAWESRGLIKAGHKLVDGEDIDLAAHSDVARERRGEGEDGVVGIMAGDGARGHGHGGIRDGLALDKALFAQAFFGLCAFGRKMWGMAHAAVG